MLKWLAACDAATAAQAATKVELRHMILGPDMVLITPPGYLVCMKTLNKAPGIGLRRSFLIPAAANSSIVRSLELLSSSSKDNLKEILPQALQKMKEQHNRE